MATYQLHELMDMALLAHFHLYKEKVYDSKLTRGQYSVEFELLDCLDFQKKTVLEGLRDRGFLDGGSPRDLPQITYKGIMYVENETNKPSGIFSGLGKTFESYVEISPKTLLKITTGKGSQELTQPQVRYGIRKIFLESQRDAKSPIINQNREDNSGQNHSSKQSYFDYRWKVLNALEHRSNAIGDGKGRVDDALWAVGCEPVSEWTGDAIKDLANLGFVDFEYADDEVDSNSFFANITNKGIKFLEISDEEDIKHLDGKSPRGAIPASDRIVKLDHNNPEYKKTIEAVANLQKALEDNNYYKENEPNDFAQRSQELRALTVVLSAPQVSVPKMEMFGWGTLGYLATKFADEPIGELAKMAWQFLQELIKAGIGG